MGDFPGLPGWVQYNYKGLNKREARGLASLREDKTMEAEVREKRRHNTASFEMMDNV